MHIGPAMCLFFLFNKKNSQAFENMEWVFTSASQVILQESACFFNPSFKVILLYCSAFAVI